MKGRKNLTGQGNVIRLTDETRIQNELFTAKENDRRQN